MDVISVFSQNINFFLLVVVIVALVIGSFLNVIIYRYPLMMQAQWQEQCTELLQGTCAVKKAALNLAYPASHCPHCQHRLSVLHNIPVLSFLFLKGKCAFCKHKISLRYLVIELLSALLGFIIAYHYGFSWQTAAGLFFTWILLCLTAIDLEHQLLPDELNYIGLWVGLFLSLFNVFIDPQSAIIGGLCGYLSLWTVAMLFKYFTGKEGMGHGDFKLFAFLGAWLGWQMLPLVILIASSLGAIIGISLIAFKKLSRNTPIPFGPYLALAGWIALLWGKNSLNLYIGIYA